MPENLLSILAIDDDRVDILTLKRGFEKNKMSNPLFIANDGIEALDMLRGTNGREKILPAPRIILLDIHMPRMNGLEFLKELRADMALRSASVFVLTSSDDDKDRIEAYNYNVAGYIAKPVTMESFIKAVATLKNFWKLSFNDEVIKPEQKHAAWMPRIQSLN
jgi:CheY-like chemotaxis protein